MTVKILRSVILAVSMCLLVAPLAAKEKAKLPETTKDGLQLEHRTKHGAVYLKPGATLDAYSQVKILDAYVAFQKNWKRNFNEDQMSLENRVTNEDMEQIKTRLAKEFQLVFAKVLKKGGYQVVDTTGKEILLLRPAIINLVVTAPDLMTAGMTTNVVSSAGSMTLYLELYDSLTSDKIAEVIDSEEAGMNSFAQAANRVTNKEEFDQTLEAWAKILVKRLDEAHGKASK